MLLLFRAWSVILLLKCARFTNLFTGCRFLLTVTITITISISIRVDRHVVIEHDLSRRVVLCSSFREEIIYVMQSHCYDSFSAVV